jgi:hypothetical protein
MCAPACWYLLYSAIGAEMQVIGSGFFSFVSNIDHM